MYQRFLNNTDYLGIIPEDLFQQVTRGIQDRVVQAEQSAEMSIREYLDNYYEIDEELSRGKCIKEYCPMLNYPPGVFFIKEDTIEDDIGKEHSRVYIYRTQKAINGYKKPTTKIYWKQLVDLSFIKDIDKIEPYFQTRTYLPGDIVKYGTEYWQCLIGNGFDFENIQIPGLNAWKEVETEEWTNMYDYPIHSVVKFKNVFYSLVNKPEDHDVSISPLESDDWGQIGEYTTDYIYDASEGAYDYVVAEDKVFYPVINPNADSLVVGENIAKDEPRNLNLVKHMTRIALYYLHQTISPTNISETRRLMYEESMNWLLQASKFKINPMLKRKKDDKGKDKVDWAFADYHKDFNVDDNEWII